VVDWNSDGLDDLISGDRNGYFNVFIRNEDSTLTAYYQYRLADSTVIDVGYNSQPAAVDWNGDGMKDLLLGTETGYVQFYANIGTDTWPMFQLYENVTAGGSAIYYNRVNPYVFDLDRDGVQDLICGANDGYVRFFRNSGTNAMPILEAPESLRTSTGQYIQPQPPYYYGSRCGFGYWDSDSLPDCLLSGYDGMVMLYRGAALTGVEERSAPPAAGRTATGASIVRGMLSLRADVQRAVLVDAGGRTVMPLKTGSNDVSALAPGVYFVRAGGIGTRVLVCR
jgi:hypothetical protein